MRNLLLVTALFGAAFAASAATHSRSGDGALKGERAFADFGCSSCHGTTGAGGGWQGPRLAPDPLPFAAFLAQLREPAAKMPRYSPAVLSDAEAAELYAYLRSVPKGKTAGQIPILQR